MSMKIISLAFLVIDNLLVFENMKRKASIELNVLKG